MLTFTFAACLRHTDCDPDDYPTCHPVFHYCTGILEININLIICLEVNGHFVDLFADISHIVNNVIF